MFNNIDRKIKGLAVFCTIVGIIGSFIGTIYFWINDAVLIGFIVLICGILASWIGSFMLYGFGELISKSSNIEEGIKRLQFLTVGQNSNQSNKYNDLLCKVNKDIVNDFFDEHLTQSARNENAVKGKATNSTYDDNSIKEISTSNILIRFKISKFQPAYNNKLIGKIMQIEHVTNADISPEGILTCYYDDTIKTPSDIAALKEVIKANCKIDL